jgi:hypothetical protein
METSFKQVSRLLGLFSLFLSGFFFISCEPAGEETFKRTIIVYLGRDNSLSSADEEKIKYLLDGWNGQNGNLIIYQDKTGEKPVLLEAYRDKAETKTRVVAEYEDENSASVEVLNRVLRYGITNYPADSYGLILFSHMSGWLPASTLTTPRSIVIDQTSEMELAGFAEAIPDGYFDFIIFEACFASGIEVAYELKDKTRYILGSSAEVLSPGFKDTYVTSLHYLFEKEAGLESFARALFAAISTSDAHYRSATFSLIKTSRLEALGRFLKAGADKEAVVDVSAIQPFGRKSSRLLFFDFEDYFSRILKNAASREELSSLLNECVVYKAATETFLLDWDGFNITRHSGLTTYIPQEQYPYLNEEYKKLSWYKLVFE